MVDKPRDKLPPCENKVQMQGGGRRRCGRSGYHCSVVGEFGRHNQVLCHPCVKAVRACGWKVTYQIQGDNPPLDDISQALQP